MESKRTFFVLLLPSNQVSDYFVPLVEITKVHALALFAIRIALLAELASTKANRFRTLIVTISPIRSLGRTLPPAVSR
jgi:hypothetical protein